MRKPIAIGMSPNTRSEDNRMAFGLLFSPRNYLIGSASHELELWFETFFRSFHAVSFGNARGALYALLKVIGVGKGDEVILQGYTCVVVPNSIIALGATPIYVDITASLAMNPKLLEAAITAKTKAIIVQHTFGIPADMDAIMKIAKARKIPIIEDAAHVLGGEYKGKKLGSFGMASIFSFGRDKAFSSTFGGIAITKDETIAKKLQLYQQTLSYPSERWTIQQLAYPLATGMILSTYSFVSLGKVLHLVFSRLHILSLPVSQSERNGVFLESEVLRFPQALATLALAQVRRLDTYNQRREEIVSVYRKMAKELSLETCQSTSSILLRFPLLVLHPVKIKAFFAEHGVYLGDWYTQAVDPKDVLLPVVGYKKGSCPNAEKIASRMINLPTYPTMTDENVEYIIYLMKKYVQN